MFVDVALFVAVDFLLPEVGVCLGHLEVWAVVVSMPEATVDKDDCAVFAQHDVGMSGQTWVVQPEPVTTSEEKSSYCQFRFCVLAAYGSHVVVPLAVC